MLNRFVHVCRERIEQVMVLRICTRLELLNPSCKSVPVSVRMAHNQLLRWKIVLIPENFQGFYQLQRIRTYSATRPMLR
jgi:hypothetical protein